MKNNPVNAGEDRSIEYGESITLLASGGSGNYRWETENNSFGKELLVQPEETRDFIVHDAVLASKCSSSDTVRVVVNKTKIEGKQHFIVPTIFTPNEDGKNEEFQIQWEGEKPIVYDLSIYNRWGTLIFQTDQPFTGFCSVASSSLPPKTTAKHQHCGVTTFALVLFKKKETFTLKLNLIPI